MSTTPEALRLAVLLENPPSWESQPQFVEGWASDSPLWDAAAELRRLAAVEAERDQLRAEVEALRADVEGYVRTSSELAYELTELRADAERYRWLRNEAWGCGNKRGPHLVEFKPGHVPSRFTDLAEEAADAAVDAARKA